MEHQVKFTGNAKEYFGIWIVNILLSILTLGIYSAWAKVRTNRYFYGNTSIDGHAFEYHATGKQILIGRVIVVGALVLYQIFANIAPIAALVLLVAYIGLSPWLIVRGLRFSRRMTSYRNVRFDFKGSYRGAFWAFIALPVLNVFTVFLITPIVTRTFSNFIAKNSLYGDRPFDLDMPLKPLYKFLAIFIGIVIVAVMLLSVLLLLIPTSALFGSVGQSQIFISLFIILFSFVPILYQAVVRNVAYNHLSLDQKHSFTSTLKPSTYFGIYLSNAMATVVTFGLLAPRAKVRMARYVARKTTITVDGSLDDYTSSVQTSSGVIGSEFMDIEGVDVGLSI